MCILILMITGEYVESSNQGDYDFNRPKIMIIYPISIILFIHLITCINNN